MRIKIIFWEDYFNKTFPKQINEFVDVFTNKLVPLFENINDESDVVAEKEYEKLNEVSNPEYVDISEILDDANYVGFSYYQMMHSVRQALINIAAVALYHMFEQQINYFLKIEILPYIEEGDKKKGFEKIKKKLYRKVIDFGIDIDSIPSYIIIDELRIVSNFIKHADEKYEKQLKAIRPELFINTKYNKILNSHLSLNEQYITFPLIGKEFYLTVEDIHQYSSKIISFWQEFWKEIIKKT